MKAADLRSLGLKLTPGAMNIFDTCWICPAVSGLEDHHIIPRHCGGENGPQVRLCGVCHTSIHNMAMNAKTLKHQLDVRGILQYNGAWQSAAMIHKGLALAYVIARANKTTKGDANRKVKFSTTFDGETSRQLKEVKQSLGCSTQDETIVKLIKQAHARLFRGKE